jgi:putative hydrolase of the HAD superfamily
VKRSVRPTRIPCRAVLLDAGGVIVLPHRALVTDALARVDIDVDASVVSRAHYATTRKLDRDGDLRGAPAGYLRTFCSELGVPAERLEDAVRAMSRLADRSAAGEILWSEAAPEAQSTIAALQRARIAVLVVTNSDGHAAENLRDAAICQTTAGAGATVTDVIDSALVGSSKPDVAIFRAALERVHVHPASVVHVGDMVSADVDGARAAGITPIHLDPYRRCRARDHRHLHSLSSIWRHVAPPSPVGIARPHGALT